jgi:hypothetical protein
MLKTNYHIKKKMFSRRKSNDYPTQCKPISHIPHINQFLSMDDIKNERIYQVYDCIISKLDFSKNTDTFQYLYYEIEKLYDSEIGNLNGGSVLHIMVRLCSNYNEKVDTLYQIIEKIILIDSAILFIKDENGNTALHLACGLFCSDIKLIEILLKTGNHSVNMQNSKGDTVLHMILKECCFFKLKQVSLLLANEFINLRIKDSEEQTPLDIAESSRTADPKVAILIKEKALP